MAELDTATRKHKAAMLTAAIDTKSAEVSYLQTLFSETAYKSATESIYSDVISNLASDAGLSAATDGSIPDQG
jgi:hypothetical protein